MTQHQTRADSLRERLRATEEALVTSASEGEARYQLRQRYGVSTRTVRRWIRAVHALWRREGTREQRAAYRLEQRAKMRSTLNHILARAFAENDLRTATTVAGRLIELDGLDRGPERSELVAMDQAGSTGSAIDEGWKLDPWSFMRAGQAGRGKAS